MCSSLGGEDFLVIYKRNKAIRYLLGVEVAWGNFFTEVMGCRDVKDSRLHDDMARAAGQVADEVLDTLEIWFRWGSNMTIETFDIVNDIRADVLHNMYKFSNM